MIPTAEIFIINKLDKAYPNENKPPTPKQVEEWMIEFAKMHVEATLKAAAENASAYVSTDDEPTVSKGSIFSAYRLSNIK